MFNFLARMIKMTSPNINIVIVVGGILGYVTMVILGLDTRWVSLPIMAKLIQVRTLTFTLLLYKF